MITIHNIAIALSLMLSCSARQALAREPMADAEMREMPTFHAPDHEEEITNRYIVKYKADSNVLKKRMKRVGERQAASNLRKRPTLDNAFLTYGKFLPQDNAEVLYLKSEEDVKKWKDMDHVEYVEPDTKVYLQAEETPYGITKVQALDIPDTNVSNRKVCIIDSGYDIEHPDLPSDPNVVTGYSGPMSEYRWDKDELGHGTHVAGTIAAIGGNSKGVVGVSRNGELNLHIVNVFNGARRWTWKSTLISAVEECVDKGANIVNMSLGGPYASQLEREAFDRIFNVNNVLLVAAAGNGANTDYSYPASYDSVMSVAGTDSNNNLYNLSQQNDQVDIAAPGVMVKSTVPTNIYQDYPYASWSGTSMATPHVSGVAALLWSLDTAKSAVEIRKILEDSAEDLGAEGRDNSFGHGLVRADRAKALLMGEGTCVDSTKKFVWAGTERDCAWLRSQRTFDRESICLVDKDIADACPKTCMECGGTEVVINFDEDSSGWIKPYSHSDIQFENAYSFDASKYYSGTGYNYGTVSRPNVALNGWGDAMGMRCPDGQFNLRSISLTSAWYNYLPVNIEGYKYGFLTAFLRTSLNSRTPTRLDSELASFENIDYLVIRNYYGTQVAVDDIMVDIMSPCTAQVLDVVESASYEDAAAQKASDTP